MTTAPVTGAECCGDGQCPMPALHKCFSQHRDFSGPVLYYLQRGGGVMGQSGSAASDPSVAV
jgi:hypothetical protein